MIREPIRYVVYLRASTGRQRKGSLGMDAQYAAVVEFLRQHGGTIVAQYIEVESGNRSDRPELAKALASVRNGNPPHWAPPRLRLYRPVSRKRDEEKRRCLAAGGEAGHRRRRASLFAG